MDFGISEMRICKKFISNVNWRPGRESSRLPLPLPLPVDKLPTQLVLTFLYELVVIVVVVVYVVVVNVVNRLMNVATF